MKKMVRNKPFRRISKTRNKELEAPFWMQDGFVGILALMIYNFLLYVLSKIGVGGIIREMQTSTGYFGLRSFIDLGLDLNGMTIGIIIVFVFCFFLGMIIGNFVRINREENL